MRQRFFRTGLLACLLGAVFLLLALEGHARYSFVRPLLFAMAAVVVIFGLAETFFGDRLVGNEPPNEF